MRRLWHRLFGHVFVKDDLKPEQNRLYSGVCACGRRERPWAWGDGMDVYGELKRSPPWP